MTTAAEYAIIHLIILYISIIIGAGRLIRPKKAKGKDYGGKTLRFMER